MNQLLKFLHRLSYRLSVCLLLSACNENNAEPTKESIAQMDLKRGAIISCGNIDKQYGTLSFNMSCDETSKEDFNLAIKLLHSFEYDESEKVFAKIIDQDPKCAMAYWGVAMCNFHALWTPPTEQELKKGSHAIKIAQAIAGKSKRESAYIDAMATFYNDWEKTSHQTRCKDYEKAMQAVHTAFPDDKEAAIFYSLALVASADPTDKNFVNQKKAGSILQALYPSEPNHPGVIHYIIHTYDYPGLADSALSAARKYAKVAPSSAHALHMPSHIFTRLGYWEECIKSNLASVASAKCYAEQAGMKGHWDEELHGLDYLVYAYLQKGENKHAIEKLNYLRNIKEVDPRNFKVAYAYAAIPARVSLENKAWNEAAATQLHPTALTWNKFPWQQAIVHFTRLLGMVHTGKIDLAKNELAKLHQLHDTLDQQKDAYKAKQVAIQIKTGEAWISFGSGQKQQGLTKMKLAAAMEDSTEKHPVTPGEVLPARELLADMYFELADYENALRSYQAVLKKSPNRFNSLYQAGRAAEKLGDRQQATNYFRQLSEICDATKADRQELSAVREFLAAK